MEETVLVFIALTVVIHQVIDRWLITPRYFTPAYIGAALLILVFLI